MRLLVVDHNAIEPVNQTLYRLIGGTGLDKIRVIVPALWHDGYDLRAGVSARISDGCEVVPVPVYFSTRTHRLIYRGLTRQLHEFPADVLYVNAEPENFQAYQCARAIRRFPGLKLVFSTWRNIDYGDGRYPYRLSAIHRMMEKSVLSAASHGIAFNSSAAKIFSYRGFRNMSVIPPEVDTGVFSRRRGARRRRFTVGYAGRLEEGKGVDLLLDAVAGLPRDVRLRIVGAGMSEPGLRARAERLGLRETIDWIPPVRRSGMPEQYEQMDVLVLPSRTGRYWKEQFGRVLVEAMACGVPVVGSNSGEIPSVIGDAGLTFEEGNAGELFRALNRIRTNSTLRSGLAKKGLARVRETFAVDRVFPLYRTLFANVVRGQGS